VVAAIKKRKFSGAREKKNSVKKLVSRRQMKPGSGLGRLLADTLLANSSDTVFICSFDQRVGIANRGCFGHSSDEIVKGGLDFILRITAPESRKRLEQALEYLRSSGERVFNLNLEVLPKHTPHTRRVQTTLSPMCDYNKRVIGVHGVFHDITAFLETEEALKESEARFLEMVESAHDLVWTMDQDGCWTYVNPAATSIYGHPPEDLIGQPFKNLAHPDYAQNDWFIFQQVLNGKQFMLHETVHRRADGSERVLSFNIKPRMDKQWNIIGAMGTARDVTEQKKNQRQLEYFAEHDALTGLYNRHRFQNELERAVARIGRSAPFHGLIYVDLDNFKYINDTVGHLAGDKLLVEVAAVLKERLRHGDVLARFGGDEFTVLLQGINAEKLRIAAESFCRLIAAQIFAHEANTFNLSASIGATLLDEPVTQPGEFLGQADLACTIAKSRGRNQFHVYDSADKSKAAMLADVGWSNRIRKALEHGDFTLHYQPIVRVSDQSVAHYEALLRLRSDDNNGELIAPGAFLPAAERFGLMHAIDHWVVTHVISRMSKLSKEGACPYLAINLSGSIFEDRKLLPIITATLQQYQVSPTCLIFEITEREAISHFLDAKAFIGELKNLGCSIALDDFGSGFSSYSYLKMLPVDYLKIDGSFVQRLANEPTDQALVKSMNEVAHVLGKQTIAEFVEDERALRLLREYGVDYAQGYHIGMPTEDIVHGMN
jgi:diguanylate cyclase (GGDEF)-like protein/PAS domain S-box-containing protein